MGHLFEGSVLSRVTAPKGSITVVFTAYYYHSITIVPVFRVETLWNSDQLRATG